MNKKTVITILALVCTLTVQAENKPWMNKNLPIRERVNSLLDQMTVKEMIAELNLVPYYAEQDSAFRAAVAKGRVGAVLKASGTALNRSLQKLALKNSRLGIPLMFHEDVIHGYKTISPIPLAEACSWDTAMVRRSAAVAAKEAAAAGLQLTYAPMLDISVDPRWGRIMETSGEDPFLASAMARARTLGFQGGSLSSPFTVMACIKHFAGYASLTAGRDYLYTDFSQRQLEERYLPPYRAAIAAGAGSVMCSYTSFNGIPATFSRFLNHDVLRDELHFDGLLMTDWCTLSNAITEGASPDGRTSAERGIKCGIEMDMTSHRFIDNLEDLVNSGAVSKDIIREAAFHALEAKFKVGLFDDPYLYFNEKREKEVIGSEEIRQACLDMATESMVLLQNKNDVLPLSTDKKIAVVGPFAEQQEMLMGKWTAKGDASKVITVAAGMREAATHVSVGASDYRTPADSCTACYDAAQGADVVIVCLGEHTGYIGEATSTARISLPNNQLKLLDKLYQSGKKIVVVLFNGRPLQTDFILAHCDALLDAWYPGTMGGRAVANLLMAKAVPSAKLCQTFPRESGQIPIFYNMYRTFGNIRHLDIADGPQFPFGFGLSYNKYGYSNMSVSTNSAAIGTPITVSVDITNKGSREGREVVQLYVKDFVATVVPKLKELKAFRSVTLSPGETKTVSFTLDDDAFKILNDEMKWTVEKGDFEIQVGCDSEHVLTKKIHLGD
jgi:beta-glucosidase